MSTTPDDDLIQKLADEFSRSLRDWFSPDELLVFRRTRSYGPLWLQASLVLGEAFERAFGRVPDFASEADATIWSSSWVRAKNAQFPRKLQPITNARGDRVHGFIIRNVAIYDISRSDDGKESVDPADYYGLRPDEIAEFERANSTSKYRSSGAGNAGKVAASSNNSPSRVSSVPELRKLYPNLHVWPTGGDGMALRLDCADGGYILFTDGEGGHIPDSSAVEVFAGRYAANGDIVLDAKVLPLAGMAEWIDTQLACATNPKNVYDYFVKQIQAGIDDESLRGLPIDSNCGFDCVQAIDALASFITHVRSAFGHDSAEATRVICVARAVVKCYWRG